MWIVSVISKLMDSGFTGKIEINFYKGGVSNINRLECMKLPAEMAEASPK